METELSIYVAGHRIIAKVDGIKYTSGTPKNDLQADLWTWGIEEETHLK